VAIPSPNSLVEEVIRACGPRSLVATAEDCGDFLRVRISRSPSSPTPPVPGRVTAILFDSGTVAIPVTLDEQYKWVIYAYEASDFHSAADTIADVVAAYLRGDGAEVVTRGWFGRSRTDLVLGLADDREVLRGEGQHAGPAHP